MNNSVSKAGKVIPLKKPSKVNTKDTIQEEVDGKYLTLVGWLNHLILFIPLMFSHYGFNPILILISLFLWIKFYLYPLVGNFEPEYLPYANNKMCKIIYMLLGKLLIVFDTIMIASLLYNCKKYGSINFVRFIVVYALIIGLSFASLICGILLPGGMGFVNFLSGRNQSDGSSVAVLVAISYVIGVICILFYTGFWNVKLYVLTTCFLASMLLIWIWIMNHECDEKLDEDYSVKSSEEMFKIVKSVFTFAWSSNKLVELV